MKILNEYEQTLIAGGHDYDINDIPNLPIAQVTVSQFLEQIVFLCEAADQDIVARYPWFSAYIVN